MAKEEKKEDAKTVSESPPKKKSKLKWILIILLSLILMGGSAIGGFLYILKKNNTEAAGAEDSHEKTEEVAKPIKKKEYVSLERFVTNLKAIDEDGRALDKYISIEISFEILDDENKEEKKNFLKSYSPNIKNVLLLTIDKFDDKKLLSGDGKKQFAEALKTTLNDLFKEQGDKEKIKGKNVNLIEDILFTSFIIQ